MNSIYHFIFVTLIFVTHLWTNQSRDFNFVACNDQCWPDMQKCMLLKSRCSHFPQNCNLDCDNEYDECYTECNKPNCAQCNDYPFSGYCIGDHVCKEQCPDFNINCDNAECDECATIQEESCLSSCSGDANGCAELCAGEGNDVNIDCHERGYC
eukprot:302484_1